MKTVYFRTLWKYRYFTVNEIEKFITLIIIVSIKLL